MGEYGFAGKGAPLGQALHPPRIGPFARLARTLGGIGKVLQMRRPMQVGVDELGLCGNQAARRSGARFWRLANTVSRTAWASRPLD